MRRYRKQPSYKKTKTYANHLARDRTKEKKQYKDKRQDKLNRFPVIEKQLASAQNELKLLR